MKEFLFYLRWMWRNRSWKPTRQKEKAYRRDLQRYLAEGVKPW